MKALRIFLLCVGFLCGFARYAQASIVIDHPPHPYGGGGSDTLFLGPSGQQVWQRIADDFTLSSPQIISTVVAFGFYDADNPPINETMRVRFLGARVGDGLPDESNVVSELTVNNPTRIATGNIIAVGVLPHEYRFEIPLPQPVSLDAAIPYWLEFVQIGDVSRAFRWESSATDHNGQAFINLFTNEWRSTLPGGTVDTAFQLIAIPETSSIFLLVLGLIMSKKWRRTAGQPG